MQYANISNAKEQSNILPRSSDTYYYVSLWYEYSDGGCCVRRRHCNHYVIDIKGDTGSNYHTSASASGSAFPSQITFLRLSQNRHLKHDSNMRTMF